MEQGQVKYYHYKTLRGAGAEHALAMLKGRWGGGGIACFRVGKHNNLK